MVAAAGRPLLIGGATFEWLQHDVLAVPHRRFARNAACSGDAGFLVVTDQSPF